MKWKQLYCFFQPKYCPEDLNPRESEVSAVGNFEKLKLLFTLSFFWRNITLCSHKTSYHCFPTTQFLQHLPCSQGFIQEVGKDLQNPPTPKEADQAKGESFLKTKQPLQILYWTKRLPHFLLLNKPPDFPCHRRSHFLNPRLPRTAGSIRSWVYRAF